MTRTRLNWIIGLVLVAVTAAALLLMIAAARPAYRFIGGYPALPGTPNAFYAQWDTPAVYMTVLEPALVTLPEHWNLGDHICAAIRLDRGPAVTTLEYTDMLPQARWDEPPNSGVVFPDLFAFPQDREQSIAKIANPVLGPLIRAELPYRVNWIGTETVVVYDDRPVGGLICYHFVAPVNGQDQRFVPFMHRLTLRPINLPIMRRPYIQMRWNSTPAPDDPEEQIMLERVDLLTYLKRLETSAPFALAPMTEAQREQQATEIARGDR